MPTSKYLAKTKRYKQMKAAAKNLFSFMRPSLFLSIHLAILLAMAILACLELPAPEKAMVLVATTFLLSATASDLSTMTIPNWLNLAFALGMIIVAGALVPFVDSGGIRLARATISGFCVAVMFLAIHLLSSRGTSIGLGMGDVKLGFSLGIFLGWFSLHAIFTGLMAAIIINGFCAVVKMCLSHTIKDALPFAPALSMGALLGIVFI